MKKLFEGFVIYSINQTCKFTSCCNLFVRLSSLKSFSFNVRIFEDSLDFNEKHRRAQRNEPVFIPAIVTERFVAKSIDLVTCAFYIGSTKKRNQRQALAPHAHLLRSFYLTAQKTANESSKFLLNEFVSSLSFRRPQALIASGCVKFQSFNFYGQTKNC